MCLLNVCGLTSRANLLTVGSFFFVCMSSCRPLLEASEWRKVLYFLYGRIIMIHGEAQTKLVRRVNRVNNDNRNFSTLIALPRRTRDGGKKVSKEGWRIENMKNISFPLFMYLIGTWFDMELLLKRTRLAIGCHFSTSASPASSEVIARWDYRRFLRKWKCLLSIHGKFWKGMVGQVGKGWKC